MKRCLRYPLMAGLLFFPIMGMGRVDARPPGHPFPGSTLPLPPPRPPIEELLPAPAPEVAPSSSKPSTPPVEPVEVAPPPRPGLDSTPPAIPREPVASCLQRLRMRGAVVEPATPAAPPDPRCKVEEPVILTALALPSTRIDLPDHPLIACATAETFADFLGEFMVPLAEGTYGQAISSIGTGPGLECRPRNNVEGAKLSAHGQGLAIDIAQFRLADGHRYQVGEPADARDRGFDRAVRAGACGYFHTSLGPGADAAHANHWHMDLEPRGSNGTSRFCQ